jgi:mRNA interferase RelE/StbE
MLIEYEKAALKGLRRMQPKAAAAMREELAKIAADPFGAHPNAKALEGTKSSFQLRHGDWRALYRIDRNLRIVFVETILPRGEAYR